MITENIRVATAPGADPEVIRALREAAIEVVDIEATQPLQNYGGVTLISGAAGSGMSFRTKPFSDDKHPTAHGAVNQAKAPALLQALMRRI